MSLTLGPRGAASSEESFLERLDRVPLNRFHLRLLMVSGIGWMFAAMDVVLVTFLLAPIARDYALDGSRTTLVAVAGYAGMLLGAAVSGRLADRYGRRSVFTLTLVLFSIGALLSCAAPSYEVLLVARLVAGLGLGGELPVAATLVSEFAPRRQRGRMIVLLESFWGLGTLLAGLVAIAVLPAYGWRWSFFVCALPAAYAVYLRFALPESPRYLAERGRTAEADALVRRVERASGGALLTLGRSMAPARRGATRITQLFGREYARRTAMLWVLWLGIVFTTYGAFVYVPALRAARGLSGIQKDQLFFLMALAQLPGCLVAAWLVERSGRKATLITYLFGAAVSATFLYRAGPVLNASIWSALLAFFYAGLWGVGYAYATELYPTAIRGTGTGIAAAVGRIGLVAGPFLTTMFTSVVAQTGTFIVFLLALLIAGACVYLLGEETKGRSLEEIGGVAS